MSPCSLPVFSIHAFSATSSQERLEEPSTQAHQGGSDLTCQQTPTLHCLANKGTSFPQVPGVLVRPSPATSVTGKPEIRSHCPSVFVLNTPLL